MKKFFGGKRGARGGGGQDVGEKIDFFQVFLKKNQLFVKCLLLKKPAISASRTSIVSTKRSHVFIVIFLLV